ncbi:MAG TPA: sigma-70 family RNA polymerase sigma factor [Acidimicrobiales bacterium]|nr:sigma-70 family RNA polymerase sigma factor [Acidimicrobiales bacterium]
MAVNSQVALPPFQRVLDEVWHDVALVTSALAGPEDAAAVADRAWEQALATYSEAPDPRHLRAWVLEMATRMALEHHRARQRELRRSGAPAAQGSADAAQERAWSQVRALPERERLALVLHFVGNVSHAEIAAIMGTTVTTARRLISDALRSLRVPA